MKKLDIIILHGWNLSGSRFEPLATILRNKGYHVLAPDLPGFGNEPAPNRSWHVSDYATFLREYIKRKNIKKPILIGHSFGGRVAIQFTHMYPDIPVKLVITGTPGYSPVPRKKMSFFLVLAKIGGIFFSLPGVCIFSDFARKVLYRVAGAREFYRAEGTMRQTFKNIVSDDLEQPMRTISIPCLLVWGKLDSIVPVTIAEKMKNSLPYAKLIIIPEAFHNVPYANPDLFVSSIWKFLQS